MSHKKKCRGSRCRKCSSVCAMQALSVPVTYLVIHMLPHIK